MKELERKPVLSEAEGLTNLSQTPYSKGGDIFMEGKPNMPSQNPQPTGPEHAETTPVRKEPVSPEKQAAARKAWDESNTGRVVPVDERRVQEELIRMGVVPVGGAQQDPQGEQMPISVDDATKRLENAARQGEQRRREDSPKGVEAYALLNRVGITDQRILNEMNVLDNLLESGLPTDALMANLVNSMKNIENLSNVSENEKRIARESIRQAINIESQRGQRQELAAVIEAIRGMPEGEEKKDAIMRLLKETAPQRDYLHSELIKLSLSSDEAFDYLVNKIISLPLSHETAGYQLGLTSSVNLELIASVVNDEKNRAGNDIGSRNKFSAYSERLSQAQDSFRLLHEMNRLIRNGKLDEFIQTADSITPEHFNYLQRVSGVSAAMRIYEQVYDEFHTKNGWIYSEDMQELNDKVFENLRYLNSKGLFGKELEEWELTRAHAIAGKMYNITLRSAEKIATGTVPGEDREERDKKLKRFGELKEKRERAEREGRQAEANSLRQEEDAFRRELKESEIHSKHRYSSFPFESMGRILNPIQLLIWRFEVGRDKSGSSMEFLKVVKKYYKKSLEDRGEKLGKNKITRLGGVSVEEMELGGLTGISGVYSGWRQENMFISQMRTGERTVQDWLAHNMPEIESARTSKNGERLREVLTPLIENMKAGRGILLKQGPFGEEVGYLARQLLWEKIAEENLPLMMNYLESIKFQGEQNVAPSLDEIVRIHGRGINKENFKRKVMLEQEMKLRNVLRENKGEDPLNIENIFSPEETVFKQEIINAGINLAPHLADIAFPYTPFLNDTLFEVFDYRVAGHEYYRRRLASDTPSFNKASGAFTGIVDNPGVNPEEILKNLHEMERGIESPNGRPDGQRRTFPVVEAYLEWIMTRPGERHIAFKGIKQSLLKHTSEAQKYSGMDAPSVNEDQARKLIEHITQQAILDEELSDELKKKKNLKLAGLFFAMFRDLFTTLIPASLIYAVGKESIKTKS